MKEFRNKIQILKRKKYFRPMKYFLLALSLVVFLDKCTWMPMPPWKVTDPSKPGFNVENFEYEDYFDQSLIVVMPKTLRMIFPLGSNKDFIERVLLKYDNGIRSHANGDKNCYILKSGPKIHTIIDVNYPHKAEICTFYKDNILIDLTYRGTSVFKERKKR